MRDFYAYAFKGRRMGVFVWLAMYLLTIECTMAYRHSRDQFNEVMPWQSKWLIKAFAVIWCYLFCISLANSRAKKTNKAD